MERYLKDEPKLQSYKKLPTDLDTSWDLFAAPAVAAKWKVEVDPIILDFNLSERNLDTLSTSSVSSGCSGVSWNSSLSCAVVVKKERLDDEDDEDNSDSYDENHLHDSKLFNVSTIPIQTKTENSIELRVVARTTDNNNEILPTLTPPSSPESVRNTSSSCIEPEIALLGHPGILRVAGGHIPRSAIVRLTTAGKNGSVRFIQVGQGFPGVLTHRSTSSPASPASHPGMFTLNSINLSSNSTFLFPELFIIQNGVLTVIFQL